MWFHTHRQANECRTEFLPPPHGRYWPPQVLGDHPLDLGNLQGRALVLTGKGSVWMYAHAAALGVYAGPASIEVEMPDRTRVPLLPLPWTINSVVPQWHEIRQTEKGDWILRFLDGTWDPAVLSSFEPKPLAAGKDLYITGRGSVWMYGGLVARAMASGFGGAINCVMPAEDGAIRIWPRPTASDFRPEPPSELDMNGIVLGVVGDPNSGKSVFAGALERCARQHFKTVWRLDCDAASPTPNWYLEMSRGREQERAVALRAEQKRGWDEKLEAQVAQRIQRCARRVHLTVADLPGGWFHDGQLERVPPGREVILESIDHFVILGRAGTDAAREWLYELEQRGWAQRVVAVFNSRDPEIAPSGDITMEDRWSTGSISGLDRQRNEKEIDAALASVLAPVFKALMNPERNR